MGAGQLPADALQVGDAIRVVSTPGQQGDVVEAELLSGAEGSEPDQSSKSYLSQGEQR